MLTQTCSRNEGTVLQSNSANQNCQFEKKNVKLFHGTTESTCCHTWYILKFGKLDPSFIQTLLYLYCNFCFSSVLQIILNSMHRFQPRIYLVIRPEHATGPIVDLEREFYRSYIFPETIFTAVTAYQNQLVRKRDESWLKKKKNPTTQPTKHSL